MKKLILVTLAIFISSCAPFQKLEDAPVDGCGSKVVYKGNGDAVCASQNKGVYYNKGF